MVFSELLMENDRSVVLKEKETNSHYESLNNDDSVLITSIDFLQDALKIKSEANALFVRKLTTSFSIDRRR